jgi:hypothetical protein
MCYLLDRLFKIGLRIESHEPTGCAAFLCLLFALYLERNAHC